MAKFELKGKYTDGSDWTAGTFDVPTSLPNYVSFEKPISINMDLKGGEKTLTGVAEFEANGAMESGEYHIVEYAPLVQVIPLSLSTPPVADQVLTFGAAYFNRKPIINETFLFRTISNTQNKLTFGVARCKSDNFECVVENKSNIPLDSEDKKHLKHVIVTQSLCQICFDYLSTTENAPASVASLTSQLTEFYSLGGTAKVIPASGTFLFSDKVFIANHVEVTAAGELKITGSDASNPNSLLIQSISITNGAINFYLIY